MFAKVLTLLLVNASSLVSDASEAEPGAVACSDHPARPILPTRVQGGLFVCYT